MNRISTHIVMSRPWLSNCSRRGNLELESRTHEQAVVDTANLPLTRLVLPKLVAALHATTDVFYASMCIRQLAAWAAEFVPASLLSKAQHACCGELGLQLSRSPTTHNGSSSSVERKTRSIEHKTLVR